MWKNSTELLDYALRELRVAIKKGKRQVEIILDDNFLNDTKVVKKYCDELELKTITEMLREEFDDYNIKSVVKSKGDLKGIITFERGPCAMYYPLVWRLTLRKK